MAGSAMRRNQEVKNLARTLVLGIFLATAFVGGWAVAQTAETCAELVAYGRSRIGSVENDELRTQITNLLDQAEQQCNGGAVAVGIETAKQAIDLIK
jgi:hypothetical protein